MVVSRKELQVLTLSTLVVSIFFIASLFSPLRANAFPFGGQVNDLIHCINAVTYVTLGQPTPGPYIWTPATRTYDFGPPAHSGQWLLGLAGVPAICVVKINFFSIDVRPGWMIMMMGSSR